MGNFRSRMFDENDYDEVIKVNKLNSNVLCGQSIKRFGNEDKHQYLKEEDQTTLKLLEAANHFIPVVMKVGTDLTNAVFIFSQPEKQFAIKAGNGDWEFYFAEDADKKIKGQHVRYGSLWLSLLHNDDLVRFIKLAGSLLSVIYVAAPIAINLINRAITWFEERPSTSQKAIE
ncbi:uncharacterized protein LOC144663778 [Oculina patagonica]